MSTKNQGFKLVELLVIIGIIVVLALVLLPILQRHMSHHGHSPYCKNNLKQIGLVFKMYSSEESNGLFPPLKRWVCGADGVRSPQTIIEWAMDGNACS